MSKKDDAPCKELCLCHVERMPRIKSDKYIRYNSTNSFIILEGVASITMCMQNLMGK